MLIFEVAVPRKLLCYWPENKEVKLLDCSFTHGNDPYEFFVKTEVAAENEDDARRLGCDKCEDAIDFFRFCTGEDVLTSSSQVTVRKKGSAYSTGNLSLNGGVLIASPNPLTSEQLENLSRAQIAIEEEQNEEKKEALKRAIHWHARGHLEMESKIDRFIKFWIGLEVLVEYEEGKNDVIKVKKCLKSLYPESDMEKIGEVVGRIYGIRKEIVHHGVRQPKELDDKLGQLENIFTDILRVRLALQPKFLAKCYFV